MKREIENTISKFKSLGYSEISLSEFLQNVEISKDVLLRELKKAGYFTRSKKHEIYVLLGTQEHEILAVRDLPQPARYNLFYGDQ